MMNKSFKEFKDIFRQLFQIDRADLDFGIYRILNHKRDEVEDFLDNKLLPQVKEILSSSISSDHTKLKNELEAMKSSLKSAGVDPNTAPKYLELKKQFEDSGSLHDIENDVYSHLTNFFKRYYKDGDYISMRRYKDGVYAIPYEGEEVKLYRANHDQYYIKTSENLKNYVFKIGEQKVIFRLVEASTEQNNNKSQNNMERYFALHEEDPFVIEADTLVINFSYEVYEKSTKQADLSTKAIEILKEKLPTNLKATVFALMSTEKNKNRTVLEKHLNDFTAKHTFDYFIHKDLHGFLSRELDFYIKNEVLHIDDIDETNEANILSQMAKIKAIKGIASKIITMVAQLEEFQKRLWEKKKFVTNAQYCITLDRIPQKFYDDIFANKDQLKEWKSLYDVEVKTKEDLTKEKYLVLDTKFFSPERKDKLLAEFDNLDQQCDGLLINSENRQTLNLLQDKYREQAKCVYIDPPYNTGSDGFPYRDNFKHSSWLSFMYDRINLSVNLMKNSASIFSSINDNESDNLFKLLSQNYSELNYQTKLSLKVRHEDRILRKDISYQECMEDIHFAAKKDFIPGRRISSEEKDPLKDYIYSIETIKCNEIIQVNGMDIEVYKNGNYKLKKENPNQKNLKRYTIRGSLITQSGSASEFYERYLRQRRVRDGEGTLYKVIGMGEKGDGLGYRYIQQPEINGGDNGIYFQGLPLKAGDDNGNPYQNFFDFVREFNNCVDEGGIKFQNGKKPLAVIDVLFSINGLLKDSLILDYFAGSGTTGHAVIKLNRSDKGKRRYILVEMGEYFDSVTKPRIQKVIYSDNRKDGKPQDKIGISHMFKYLELESYEDTLNNLALHTEANQKSLLVSNHSLQEEYMLKYMLDVETQGSFLSVDDFIDPFSYSLAITKNNETKQTIIDLPETFNYLIGLYVEQQYRANGYKVVIGHTLDEKKVLVIRRNRNEKTNADLNTFFSKLCIDVKGSEFDMIYVNGDTLLENIRTEDQHWKVMLTEEVFIEKMFGSIRSF